MVHKPASLATILRDELVSLDGGTMTGIPTSFDDAAVRLTRRHFLSRSSLGLGSAALASLLGEARADGPGSTAARRQQIRRERAGREYRRGIRWSAQSVSFPAQGKESHLSCS